MSFPVDYFALSTPKDKESLGRPGGLQAQVLEPRNDVSVIRPFFVQVCESQVLAAPFSYLKAFADLGRWFASKHQLALESRLVVYWRMHSLDKSHSAWSRCDRASSSKRQNTIY